MNCSPAWLLLFFLLHTVLNGAELRLGARQEFGYDSHIEIAGGKASDSYSRSTVRAGLDHPVQVLDGRLSLNPAVSLWYLKYARLSELDTFGFQVSGPLSLRFGGSGGNPDTLSLALELRRDLVEVSLGNDARTPRTNLSLSAVYTRHWPRAPRWKSELRYRYDHEFHDDSDYKDLDSSTHGLSTAILYGLNRDSDVGVALGYTREDRRGTGYSDSDTWDVEALVRRRVTERIEGELALGHETVIEDGGNRESGMTARGALDYVVTPRLHCRAGLSHRIEASDTAGRSGVTTTRGDLGVAYRIMPKLTGQLTPAISIESGGNEVTEVSLVVGATYAARLFDVIVRTAVRDRSSGRGGDDDYVAVDAVVGIDVGF